MVVSNCTFPNITSGPIFDNDTWVDPDAIGNIPPFSTADINGLVLEANNVWITKNFFGTEQNIVLYGNNITFERNNVSDADLRLEPTNPKMLTNARGGFPIANITVRLNDFCQGSLTAAVVDSLIEVHSRLPPSPIGSYGPYQITFTKNSIASILYVYMGRDQIGFSLNVNSTLNVNCLGIAIDPNRTLNQYTLPFPTSSPLKTSPVYRGGVFRKSSFTGFETTTIGTCASGFQSTPDTKFCEQCLTITSANIGSGLSVDLRREVGCLFFDVAAAPSPSEASTRGLPWWVIFLIMVAAAVILFVLTCWILNWSYISPGIKLAPRDPVVDDIVPKAPIGTSTSGLQRRRPVYQELVQEEYEPPPTLVRRPTPYRAHVSSGPEEDLTIVVDPTPRQGYQSDNGSNTSKSNTSSSEDDKNDE